MSACDPVHRPWRNGRKVGRTVYAMVADLPSEDDVLIGVMDTRELAWEVVAAHNSAGGWDEPAMSPEETDRA